MDIHSVYYSPTYSTKKIADYIASQLNADYKSVDLTDYKSHNLQISYSKDDLLVVGAPVYGGRIPLDSARRFENIKGKDTPVILFVGYGNRDYDDALLELKTILESQGFIPIAASAIVTEHSIYRDIARGRPDSEDMKEIDDFINDIKEVLDTFNPKKVQPIKVKGDTPYREFDGIPLKMKTNKRLCKDCTLCARDCPVQAIPKLKPHLTNHNLCIRCMRCQFICPNGARDFGMIAKKAGEMALKKKTKVRRDPEFIIAKQR